MKIALIDDSLSTVYLKTPQRIKSFHINADFTIEESIQYNLNVLTHATICAIMLENLLDKYQLIHFDIFDSNKESGNVEKLLRAMKQCLYWNIDIISLSMGSVRLSQGKMFIDLLSQLRKNGCVIVSALSNRGVFTVPASLQGVIGVAYDHTLKRPLNSNVSRVSKNYFGVDLLTKFNKIDPIFSQFVTESNSYSVPIAVAEVAKLLRSHVLINRSNAIDDIMKKMPGCSITVEYLLEQNKKKEHEIPLYVHLSDGIVKNSQSMTEMMDYLCTKHNIESLCVTKVEDKDIRFINIKQKNEWDTLPYIYYVDIIFIWKTNMSLYMYGGLKIKKRRCLHESLNKKDCEIIYDNEKISELADRICEYVYE